MSSRAIFHLFLHAAGGLELATPQQGLGQLALAHQRFRMIEAACAFARRHLVFM